MSMMRLGKDYKGILGAAIGDICGSAIEFNPYAKPKTKQEASLFPAGCAFTDDTVLTAAIADSLANKGAYSPEESLRYWGRKYPSAGYGGMFHRWLFDETRNAYNSFGNGSAMRTSAVAYFAETIEEAEALAKRFAEATHNHPEGIKGAVVVTSVIFKALHGASKDDLRTYAASQYDFEFLDYEDMKAFMGHGEEICQVTVPQALWCFFHSESFEDCLRLALTIGWDADTLADIACAMAEAYYKELPDWIVIGAQKRLPTDIRKALESVPVSTDEAKTALKMIVTMEPSWRMGDEVYLEKLTLSQNGIEYERTEKDMDDTDIATTSLKLLTGKQEYKDAFEKMAAEHFAFFSSGQNYGILDGPVGDVIFENPAGRRKFENVSLPIGWILRELAPFLPKSWDYPGKNDEEE